MPEYKRQNSKAKSLYVELPKGGIEKLHKLLTPSAIQEHKGIEREERGFSD